MTRCPTRRGGDLCFEDGPAGRRSVPAAIAALVPAVAAFWAAWALADPPARLERRFTALTAALPTIVTESLLIVALLPALLLPVVGVVAARFSRRTFAVGLAATVRGAASAALLAAIGPGSFEDWVDQIDTTGAWAP